MNNPLRTFIALELNSDFHKAIAQIQSDLKKLNLDMKWVKPEIAHLTLKFLGDVPEKKIEAVVGALKKSLINFKPFAIELTHIGAFPRIEFPQVLWIGLGGEIQAIKSIVAVLENELGEIGFKKEKRDFEAHITIGRLRSKKNLSLLTNALKNYFVPHSIKQAITHLTLFKSTLTPQGPIYKSLIKIELR